MSIEINYKVGSEERSANLREFVARVHAGKYASETNVLPDFNHLLQWFAEMVFKEGYEAGQKHQKKGIFLECVAPRQRCARGDDK